jgi:hypothetical protein
MAHKPISRIGFGFLAAVALLLPGCESTPKATPPADAAAKASAAPTPAAQPTADRGPRRIEAKKAAAAPAARPEAATKPTDPAVKPADPTAALMDPGDEVVDSNPIAAPAAPAAKAPTAAERAAAARMAAESDRKRQAAAAASAAAADPDAARGSWGVLLATATGSDARATAMSIRDEIARRYPELRDAFVSSTQRGSVVMVGRFGSPKDDAAQARLAEVKKVAANGGPVFPKAMLTRISASANQGPPGPNDLRIVRQASPNGDLYTLQVAVWSSFGSDEIKMSEVRRSAEDYCRQLRSQGNEAYYFHDFDTRTSTVTVGVFGADAYDPRSTLYSPEVEAVMRKFPKHLVNGEELLVPLNPADPAGKTMPQAPRLVEIPKS